MNVDIEHIHGLERGGTYMIEIDLKGEEFYKQQNAIQMAGMAMGVKFLVYPKGQVKFVQPVQIHQYNPIDPADELCEDCKIKLEKHMGAFER